MTFKAWDVCYNFDSYKMRAKFQSCCFGFGMTRCKLCYPENSFVKRAIANGKRRFLSASERTTLTRTIRLQDQRSDLDQPPSQTFFGFVTQDCVTWLVKKTVNARLLCSQWIIAHVANFKFSLVLCPLTSWSLIACCLHAKAKLCKTFPNYEIDLLTEVSREKLVKFSEQTTPPCTTTNSFKLRWKAALRNLILKTLR